MCLGSYREGEEEEGDPLLSQMFIPPRSKLASILIILHIALAAEINPGYDG